MNQTKYNHIKKYNFEKKNKQIFTVSNSSSSNIRSSSSSSTVASLSTFFSVILPDDGCGGPSLFVGSGLFDCVLDGNGVAPDGEGDSKIEINILSK